MEDAILSYMCVKYIMTSRNEEKENGMSSLSLSPLHSFNFMASALKR